MVQNVVVKTRIHIQVEFTSFKNSSGAGDSHLPAGTARGMIESRQQPYNLGTKPMKSEGLDTRESTSPTSGDTNFIEMH